MGRRNDVFLRRIAQWVVSKVCMEETPSSNMINICRDNIMDGAIRAFTRRSFKPGARISVVFMDETMQAEGAVDEGGPSREFYRLLMMAIRDSTIFTGPEDKRNLSLDCHALHRNIYKTYGIMIAVALLHGGVLPAFFSEHLYKNICCCSTPPPTLDEVTDEDLQSKLRKFKDFASDVIRVHVSCLR